MRFGVRLPGPFFATFGRTARGQARRNLQVRAHERDILARMVERERANQAFRATATDYSRRHFAGPGILNRVARYCIAWVLLFRTNPVMAFFLLLLVAAPIGLIVQAGSALRSALMSPAVWGIVWPSALLLGMVSTIGYLIVKELRVLRSQRIGHKD